MAALALALRDAGGRSAMAMVASTLERLAPEQVIARVIARESDANLASITYHFGSKDNLITEAVIEGLDRWLAEIAGAMGEVESVPPAKRFARSGEILDVSAKRHPGLAKNLIAALARAQHDGSMSASSWRPVSSAPAAASPSCSDWETIRPPATQQASSWPSSTGCSSRRCSIPVSPSRASSAMRRWQVCARYSPNRLWPCRTSRYGRHGSRPRRALSGWRVAGGV